jgi:hypothetical protein
MMYLHNTQAELLFSHKHNSHFLSTICQYISTINNRVGLGRVVREVRQHPEDHEFESQRWQ